MLKKITSAFEAGELDELKNSIVPFMQDHVSELKNFITNFKSTNEEQPLDSVIKFFLISMNMPVNFKFYMNSQSRTMESEIGPDIKDPEKRNKLVTKWIGRNAKNYRAHSILEQIYCFEQCKQELVPQIEKLLEDSE